MFPEPNETSSGGLLATAQIDEPVRQKSDGFEKSSSSRRANLSGVRRTLVRRSDFEMQRNAEIGLFAEPSKLIFEFFEDVV
jgi:hypothetical protein